jgi:(p)ppGpp synthase/HD superfamily hydrolase
MTVEKTYWLIESSNHESIIKDAFSMAKEAHDHQLRDSGAPYLTHPLSVAGLYKLLFPDDDVGIAACIIHDVLEKSSITAMQIYKFFGYAGHTGHRLSFIVDALTKRPLASFPTRNDQLQELYSWFFPACY